jgi:hypothetical protein
MQAPLPTQPSLFASSKFVPTAEFAATFDRLKRLHSFLSLKKKVGRKPIGARELVPVYWRKLIEVGVPIDAAKAIAWAIVRFDAAQILPSHEQQQLLTQYCRFICRAGLWRSGLLATT